MLNRLQKIWNHINRRKIRSQLLTVYFLAGLVPILIIGSYLIVNNRNQVLQQHYDLTSAYNIRAKSIILNVTSTVTKLAERVFEDDRLQSILARRYSTLQQVHDACGNYAEFDDIENNYAEISNIAIYYNNPTMVDYGHFQTATPEDRKTSWYRFATQNSMPHWMMWAGRDSYGNQIPQLRYVLKIPVIQTGEFAVLVIDINNNHLKSEIGTDSPATVLSVNQDPVFFSTTSNSIGKPIPVSIDYKTDIFHFIGITDFDKEKNLLEISSLSPITTNDKIYITSVDYNALPRVNSITFNCALIVLISLFVPLMMILLFSIAFSDRVNTLKKEMHKAGQGNYDITDKFNGNDELMDLFVELKTMIENIKSRDREIYQDKIVKQQLVNHQQQMEFKMLTSQINPHFLYNTLESIRMKAYINGDLEVANAVKLLGKSMRHVLESGGSAVSLQSELSYIQVYLEIIKIRFKDKINYDFCVSEKINCEDYKILPLLLQPIVENAVLHGLEEKESGGFIHIEIFPESASAEKGTLLIAVSDNGCGMSPEELKQLNEKINSKNEIVSSKIGLHNVQKRLKMFYGENYGLKITSEPGAGTKVEISLPLNWEDEENESPDR